MQIRFPILQTGHRDNARTGDGVVELDEALDTVEGTRAAARRRWERQRGEKIP